MNFPSLVNDFSVCSKIFSAFASGKKEKGIPERIMLNSSLKFKPLNIWGRFNTSPLINFNLPSSTFERWLYSLWFLSIAKILDSGDIFFSNGIVSAPVPGPYSRQFYNDSILSYNNATKVFPGVVFASLYGKKPKPYLEIPQETKAVPKVEF